MDRLMTERLILRPFEFEDLNDVQEYASDIDVCKYMLFGPNTLEETNQFLGHLIHVAYKKTPITNLEYAIEFNHKVIGAVSMHVDLEKNNAEIGWILNKKYHRLGIMTEAIIKLIDYGTSIFNISNLVAHSDLDNIASIRLMEKIGMKRVRIEYNARINRHTGKYESHQVVYEKKLISNIK